MTEEENKKTEQSFEGEVGLTLRPDTGTLPSTEFVKVEKNLASLGFFTPSSKRLWNAEEKTFTITTVSEGKRLELRGTIIPSAKYGLPITADQDKWIALCKILTDILQKEGRVDNPVSFTSAEILRLLRKHRHSGKNYRDVEEWLDVLYSTTIFSEGVVYLANEKRRVKDRFRVFDRAVSLGKELPDGRVAEKNYVWFSDWQLQNINSNHLLPIDLEAYRELKNHIAKALVPLLQIWLYASRDEGVFEKRYDELCQILNIQQYKYLSLVNQKLGPSLDELKQFGYLADWKVEKTSDGQNYKIIFYHGEKFHRDRQARLARRPEVGESAARPTPASNETTVPQPKRNHSASLQRRIKLPPPPAHLAVTPELIAELSKRGVSESSARKELAALPADFPVIDALEYGDFQIDHSHGRIENPAGFFIALLREKTIPPATFETSARRKARQAEERRRQEAWDAEQARLQDEERRSEEELDQLKASDPERYVSLFHACEESLYRDFPSLMKFGKPDSNLHIGSIRSRMKRLLHAEPAPEQGTAPSFLLKPVAVADLAVAQTIMQPATRNPEPENSLSAAPMDSLVPTEASATAGPQPKATVAAKLEVSEIAPAVPAQEPEPETNQIPTAMPTIEPAPVGTMAEAAATQAPAKPQEPERGSGSIESHLL